MATLRKHYVVNRPVYSENSFTEEHEKISREHKTILRHLLLSCFNSCDSKRAKRAGLTLLPIIGWMRTYKVKEWLLGDLVSGISTGLVAIMQGLAFSLLAELPPIYGLYTAFFPMLTYFFFGTSRHISVGAFPVLSLMIGAVVLRLVPMDGSPSKIQAFADLNVTQQKVLVASSVTFLMGIYQVLAMGLLQVGFVVVYLSDTLVSGFTTAAAVHIVVSQLKFVLGLNTGSLSGILSIIYTLEKIFNDITQTNICDLVMSIVIMVVVFIVKELNDWYKAKLPVPVPIETVMVNILLQSFILKSSLSTGTSVGDGLMKSAKSEPPTAPSIEVFQESAVESFPMAIVGFAVAFSVAKIYAIKHAYTIDGNQELIAFGISNMFGASFSSFGASTSPSRTAVQESSGGRTQIAGLVSAMMAMIVTVALGFLLEPLPRSVLGALVIVNLKGMLMQFREIPYLWRRDKKMCLILWLCSCLSAPVVPSWLTSPGPTSTEIMSEPQGVKIFRIPSPIFFANIDFFRDKLLEVGFNPLKVFKKRNKALLKLKNSKQQSESESDSQNGSGNQISSTSHDKYTNMEELDRSKDVKVQIDWNAELPDGISVPRVNIHSLILDFSAVSFLDISALKGLKMALREFIQIDVDVYIVSCDGELLYCMFFDDKIQTSILFPTVHDAVLHALEKHMDSKEKEQAVRIYIHEDTTEQEKPARIIKKSVSTAFGKNSSIRRNSMFNYL
uniref:Solute carrier family 26 member 3 n=1 Tax=Salarias fasciatus TaxID=181472 RepID=A0A672FEJ4_SALFA